MDEIPTKLVPNYNDLKPRKSGEMTLNKLANLSHKFSFIKFKNDPTYIILLRFDEVNDI